MDFSRILRVKLKDLHDIVSSYSLVNFRKPLHFVVVPFFKANGSGLADRLRHCISVYIFCKQNGLPFKIFHTHPFKLEDIVIPNKYDWIIGKDNFSHSIYHTRRVNIWSCYKLNGKSEYCESNYQKELLKSFLLDKRHNIQYHVYGNIHIYKDEWAQAFEELFRPSKLLEKHLNLLCLPKVYNAITLRFQNLLGDFKEDVSNEADNSVKKMLIEKCIERIEYLYANYLGSGNNPILVTSDSITFLEAVKKLNFVVTIPGEIAHPGYSENKSVEVYLKSFLDLYALSNAKSITLLKTGEMYNSGFPEFAALIGNAHYEVHTF